MLDSGQTFEIGPGKSLIFAVFYGYGRENADPQTT